MRTGSIPITFAPLSAAAGALLLAAACGGSDKEVREAHTSGYRGDFAVIYSETLATVRESYPELSEDARSGVIRTAWHPVHIQSGAEDSASQQPVSPGGPRTGFEASASLRQHFFIRFDVHVVGGKPWRVRVHGQASAWKAGEIPTPLRGPEIPHWLEGRVNSLEVAIHQRLKKYAVELKFRPEGEAKPVSEKPLDVTRFGQIPPDAARTVAEVERAAGARDIARLRTFMVDQFTYSTGDEASAETAIVMWQADPTILAEMVKTLGAGCGQDSAKAQVVCPAAAIGDAGFSGYRAGFQSSGGAWKMVFFVAGD